MQRHDYFEQLCSLALVGELSTEQFAELSMHLVHCSECRLSQAELSALANDILAVGYRGRLRPSPGEDAKIMQLRDRVISAVRAEGQSISDEAILGPHSALEHAMDYIRRARWELRQLLPRVAIAASVVALVAVSALLAQKLGDARSDLGKLKVQASRAENEAAGLNARLQQAAQVTDSTSGQLLRSEAELAVARGRADELRAALQNQRGTIQRLEQQILSLKAQSAAVSDRSAAEASALAASQEQLSKLQAHASKTEVQLVAQQFQIKDLVAQLDTEKLKMEHERELMAADREIRDLMGARDLHMIDVRDIDLKGNWKQPQGRIFLTDNKKLIFYAFDLHKAGGREKSFQVWGQRFDEASSTISLGIFRLDDQKQSRWIMKVNDPKLLASIDSVFVTVEPVHGGKRPTGKPLMYAYLRNPINHP
jgi:Type VI secretion system protein DotU